MTEKGFNFRSALKENSAKMANMRFHTNVTAFHTYLASSKDRDQIDKKIEDLIALAQKTEFGLNTWLDLVKILPKQNSFPNYFQPLKIQFKEYNVPR